MLSSRSMLSVAQRVAASQTQTAASTRASLSQNGLSICCRNAQNSSAHVRQILPAHRYATSTGQESENRTEPPTRLASEAQPPTRKLPRWAQKYADQLKNHPGSHITSFLILHEITAVLPLPLLFWLFHSFDWTPESIVTTPEIVEKGAKLAARQLERFGIRYTGQDETRYIFEGAAAYAVVKGRGPHHASVQERWQDL